MSALDRSKEVVYHKFQSKTKEKSALCRRAALREGKMELIVKRFEELSVSELFEIYRLRVSVFVVEQQCPYQEVDEADRHACHVFFRDADGIAAYLRVIEAGIVFPQVAIGRVIAVRRREGLGTKIVSEGLRVAREKLGAKEVCIEAQTYARRLYENLGFVQTSEEFLEDGIPHVGMRWEKNADKT